MEDTLLSGVIRGIVSMGIPTIIMTTLVTLFITFYFRRWEARSSKRAAIKQQENLLTMRCVYANGNLCKAIAKAVRDGESNGEMSAALEDVDKSQADMQSFLFQTASERVAGG